MNIFRLILGIFAGLGAAVLVVSAIQMVSNSLYPIPDGFDKEDPIVLAAFIQTLPVTALLIVLASYIFGSLAGGFASAKVSRQYPLPAVIVSGCITVGVVLTLIAIPHPTWFAVIATLSLLPAALIGARIAGGKIKKKDDWA